MENKLSNQDRQLIGISAWNAKLLPAMNSHLRIRQTRNGMVPTVTVYRKVEAAMQFLEEFEHAKHATIVSRLALQVSIAEAELKDLGKFRWYQFGKWIRSWWMLRPTVAAVTACRNAMAVVIDALPDDILVSALEPQPESAEESEEQIQDQSRRPSTETAGIQSAL